MMALNCVRHGAGAISLGGRRTRVHTPHRKGVTDEPELEAPDWRPMVLTTGHANVGAP
jgi:hypothetical protein